MSWLAHAVRIFFVFFLVHQGRTSQTSLPDVIIGDPNSGKYDILGPAISEKELEESLSLNITEDFDPKEDPISTSGFYQGDIIVEDEDHLIQIVNGDPQGQLSAIRNPQKAWPGGSIPYVISSSFSSQERGLIARAMAEYHQKTCIRFVPRSSHRDYIHILRGQGCSSSIGRNGGSQVVSLGNGCVHFGVIIHELMHAAGFWHEQSRYDRDNYVTIYWANILPGLQYNFDKNSNAFTTDLGLPYDYSSIMHYGSYAFTKTYGAPTIVPKRSGVTIGQRNGFSELDIQSLNLLYKCSGVKPSPGPGPKPEGCTDNHHYCSSWASLGYCGSNPGYMHINCRKSCNTCDGGTCADIGKYCVSWAAQGECQKNPAYMGQYCKQSCKLCASTKSCYDYNQYCGDWARKGECTRNPAYMRLSCKKSCGMC